MVAIDGQVVIPETEAQAIAYVRAALKERDTVGSPGEDCLEGLEDFKLS